MPSTITPIERALPATMRIAVISDIHANLHALEAVLAAVAVWETSLDLWIRLVALAGCLTWTTFGLYPRKDGSR